LFCEKEILQAFERIYDLFDKEIMKVMEENHSEEMDIPYDILVQAVRDKAMTVYEYRAIADAGDCIDYYGKELFDQRATFILSYVDVSAENEQYSVEYRTELWLLEDMNFAIVHSVVTVVKSGDKYSCITEYRNFVKIIKEKEDVFFEPEDFLCELDDLCAFFAATNEATIYEL